MFRDERGKPGAGVLCRHAERGASLERLGGFVIRQNRHPFAFGRDNDVGDDARVRCLGAHGARNHALAFFQFRHGVPLLWALLMEKNSALGRGRLESCVRNLTQTGYLNQALAAARIAAVVRNFRLDGG